jgi:hypothetical protein
VRRLDPASFEAAHGNTDIPYLIKGIYAAAQTARILEVVARDSDLQTYQLQRANVRDRPAQPAADATTAVNRHYDHTLALYTEQSKALEELKATIIKALDQESLSIIEDPLHGTLRLTVLQIIELLSTEYQEMTNQELSKLKNELTAMRWDATTNLVTFMNEFVAKVAFLQQHQFAPMEGDLVLTLQAAVSHVPLFATKADASFHADHRQRADQTLTNLVATYRRVYRNEYVHTTAADLHSANQVQHQQGVQQDQQDLEHIMASARAVIRDTKLTPDLMDTLSVEIAKTVARCLRPPSESQQRYRGGYQQQQQGSGQQQHGRGRGGGDRYRAQVPEAGYCPLAHHMHMKHTWDECRQNPVNKAKNKEA